jgi:hypothetical protein
MLVMLTPPRPGPDPVATLALTSTKKAKFQLLRNMESLPTLTVAPSGEAIRDELGKPMPWHYSYQEHCTSASAQELLQSALSVQQSLLDYERRADLRNEVAAELRTWSTSNLEHKQVRWTRCAVAAASSTEKRA